MMALTRYLASIRRCAVLAIAVAAAAMGLLVG